MANPATPPLPNDPFQLGLYIYDTVVEMISRDQMISQTFLSADLPLSKVYSTGFKQLAADIGNEFGIDFSQKDIKAGDTIGDLCSTIYDKITAKK
jgi:acyl carrier protein